MEEVCKTTEEGHSKQREPEDNTVRTNSEPSKENIDGEPNPTTGFNKANRSSHDYGNTHLAYTKYHI